MPIGLGKDTQGINPELLAKVRALRLDRTSSHVPLYIQIKDQLSLVLRSLSSPSGRFFTDEELSEIFGVSRLTVREALRELIDDGLLYRVRGVGTFFRCPKLDGDLNRLTSYFRDWTSQGKDVKVEVLEFESVSTVPEWAASRLQVSRETTALYVCRLRRVGNVPLALDHRYLPEAVGRLITREELHEKPIYQLLYERRREGPPTGVTFEVEASAASRREAQLLDVSKGDPLLVRTHVLISGQKVPLSVGRSLFRADLTRWRIIPDVQME